MPTEMPSPPRSAGSRSNPPPMAKAPMTETNGTSRRRWTIAARQQHPAIATSQVAPGVPTSGNQPARGWSMVVWPSRSQGNPPNGICPAPYSMAPQDSGTRKHQPGSRVMREETAPRSPTQTAMTTTSTQTTGPAWAPTHQMVVPYRLQPVSTPTPNPAQGPRPATSHVSSPAPVIVKGQTPQGANPMASPDPASRARRTVNDPGSRGRDRDRTGITACPGAGRPRNSPTGWRPTPPFSSGGRSR